MRSRRRAHADRPPSFCKTHRAHRHLHSFPTRRSSDLPPLKVKGKIYATIGPAVSTVEVYDPATNTWSAAAPMPTARSSLTAATVKGKIYAIGGANGSVYLNTVEIFPY